MTASLNADVEYRTRQFEKTSRDLMAARQKTVALFDAYCEIETLTQELKSAIDANQDYLTGRQRELIGQRGDLNFCVIFINIKN